jgi:hypothetical protein
MWDGAPVEIMLAMELPAKSGFEQVHQVGSKFPNTPFIIRVEG